MSKPKVVELIAAVDSGTVGGLMENWHALPALLEIAKAAHRANPYIMAGEEWFTLSEALDALDWEEVDGE